MRSIRRWLPGLWAASLCFAGVAQAQIYHHSVYLDLDNNAASGCSAITAAGAIHGAEVRLIAIVSGQPPMVTAVTRETCAGAAFATPQAQPSNYAVGTNLGLDGSDVVEFATSLNGLGVGGNARFIYLSASASGADMVSGTLVLPGLVVGPSQPVMIPAAGVMALILLVGAMLWLVRRRSGFGSSLVLLFLLGAGLVWAANFAADGQIGDWAGVAPLASDPNNDSTSSETGIEVVAVFAATEGGQLFVRVDVRDAEVTLNVAPVANDANFTLAENSALATAVGSVLATDADAGQVLSYAITAGNAQGAFTIDVASGAISVADSTALDFETTPNFTLTVTVQDNGTPSLSASATITIALSDVNEAPVIADQSFALLELSANGTVVGTPNAIDPDAGQSLSWTISAGNAQGAFAIAPVSGQITVADSNAITLANSPFVLTLEATDDGVPAASATATMTINVTDINLEPSFTIAGDPAAVDEDTGPQVIPGFVTAIDDHDGGTQTPYTFHVIANSHPALFSAGPAIDASGTLSYTPAADAHGSAAITVELQDNGGTAGGGDDTSPPVTFTITINAVNDPPNFTLPAAPDQAVLQNSGATTVAAFASAISAGPADESAQTLIFNLTPDNNALFSVPPAIDPLSGDLSFTPAAGRIGSAQVSVVLQDDGGGNDTSAVQTFVIHVSLVNAAPTFNPPADPPPVLEDAAAQTWPGFVTGIDDGNPEVAQSVSFHITGNSLPTLFAVAPAIANDGTLTYTLAADANGSADIIFVAADDGGTAGGGNDSSAPGTFTITVTPVNDAPSFTLPVSPDQNVPQGSGPQTVPGFASAISAGPADESGQIVSFNVNVTNGAGLFSIAPAIDAGTGHLTYTPGAGQIGTADISISLQDNGGTLNGGADTSAVQTFQITLEDVNEAPVPTVTPTSPITLAENTASGTQVATIAPNDPDAGQTHSYTFQSGNTGNAFAIDAAGAITVTGTLDFEGADDPYTLLVRVTDNGAPVLFTDLPIMVNLSDVNEAPSVSAGGTLAYTEGDGARMLNTAMTVTDPDTGEGIESATVQISGNYAGAEDALAFVNTPTITGVYNSGTGTLTLMGSDTPANYQAALRSVTYENSSNAPSTAQRTVSWAVHDGALGSNIAMSTIDLTPVNSAPVLTTSAGVTAYTENTAPLAVDGALNASDADSNQASGATISISAGFQSGEDVLAFVNTPSITGGYNPGTGVLTLTGTDTIGNYQSALRAVAYSNNSDAPDTSPRTVSFVLIDDSATSSAAATKQLMVAAANDAPVVTLSGVTPSFTEDIAAVTVDAGVIVIDSDDTHLESATVTIVNLLDAGAETLSATAGGGITVTYVAPTLTLSGSATLAAYQAVLQSVSYSNNSQNPNPTSRTIRFALHDGDDSSVNADKTLAVVALNDPPLNAVPVAATIDEDTALVFSGGNLIAISDADAGVGTITVTLSASNGTIDVDDSGGAVIGGDTTANVTLSGTLTQINATLDGTIFTPTQHYFGAASVQIQSNDNGNTGGGGGLADSDTINITINAVNDPPVAGNDAFDALGNTELRIDLALGATPHVADTTAGGTGVRENDSDPIEGDPVSVTSIVGCADLTPPYDCTLASGSIVSMNADGTFAFYPSATLATGTPSSDGFDYVLTDAPGNGTPGSDTGTVSILVYDKIWYVRRGASGSGRSDSPLGSFAGIAGAGGAGDSDVAGDYIFVHYDATALDSSIELEANQHLLGEGVGLSIPRNLNGNGSPAVLVAAGARTPVTSSGNTVSIGNALPVEIRGLALSASGGNAIDLTSVAAAYTGSSSLTISENDFTGASAEGIDINAAGTSTLTLAITDNSWISGAHTGNAVDITNSSASNDSLRLNISDNSGLVSNASALAINGGATARTYLTGLANNSIHGNTGGAGVTISNVTFTTTPLAGFTQVNAGTLAIGSSGNPVGTTGMAITSSQGNLFFSDLDVFAASGTGLQLSSAGLGLSFGVTANSSGGSSTIDADNGAAVDIATIALDLRLASLESNTPGAGVNLSAVSGQFGAASGSITKTSGAGTAFVVANSGAVVNYAGSLSVTSGGGVSLSGNTATTTFSGGMTLTTGANPAFSASGGGFVAVCDENPCNPAATGTLVNSLSTTSGSALNIANTSITSNRLEFRSISANGAASGISLVNTGGLGGLTVSGTGTAGSGGTIQNSSATGVILSNTSAVNLARIIVQSSGDDGINGNNVSGFTLSDSSVINNGNSTIDEGIELTDPSGAIILTNVTATGNAHNNAYINDSNNTGGSSTLSLSGGSYSDHAPASGTANHGLLIEIRGTATFGTSSIAGAVFRNNRSLGLQVTSADTANVSDLTISNNIFTDTGTGNSQEISMDLSKAQTSNMTVKVLNNTITNHNSHGANWFTAAGAGTTGTYHANIDGNQVGTVGVFDSGSAIGNGMRVNVNGDAAARVRLNSNSLREIPTGRGIEVVARNGSGGAHATVNNNTIAQPSGTAGSACGAGVLCPLAPIAVQSNCVTACNSICSAVVGNTAYNPLLVGLGGEFSIYLIETSTSVHDYEGTGASASASLSTNNPLSVTESATVGVGQVTPGTCLLPPL